MAKVLSGGFDYEKSFLPNKQETAPTEQVPAAQEQTPESWGEYGLRNIAKLPALAWETGRSGFGIGDLAKAVANSPILNLPPELKVLNALGARRVLMPSTEEAQQETAAALPRYMSEHRPEDYWAEMGITALPFLAGAGALKSVPAAARGTAELLGMLGISKAGQYGGGEIGEALGDRPLGEEIGKWAGLFGGQKAVEKAGAYTQNIPSRYFPSKILEQEKGIFESGKTEKIGKLETKKATELGKLEESKTAELGEITKEHTQKIAAAEKQRIKTELALPKEKSAFQAKKKDMINGLKNDIKTYDETYQKAKAERPGNYKKAKELEGNKSGEVDKIRKKINEIQENISEGVSDADFNDITKNGLKKAEDAIVSGKLSLKSAKRLQKNFNAQIYHKQSPTFQIYMKDLVSSLNKFIEDVGGPEHSKYWKKAESQTVEMKHYDDNRAAFVREKERMMAEVNREQFSPEREGLLKQEARISKEELGKRQTEHKEAIETTESKYQDLMKSTAKEHDALMDEIGKETYEHLVAETAKNEKIAREVSGLAKNEYVNKYGAAGLTGFLGYLVGGTKVGAITGALGHAGKLLYNEIALTRNVMKQYPEIYRDYSRLINNYESMSKKAFESTLNAIGRKIESKI